MTSSKSAEIKVDGDVVTITGTADLRTDKSVRLFFSAILAGKYDNDAWICTRRSTPLATLVVNINNFLEGRGFQVARQGIVDDAVQRDIERRRSFMRARDAAKQLRDGTVTVDPSSVATTLKKFGWNDAQRRLFPHQEIGVIHGLTAINAANFSVPGAGKTVTALAIAATHLANDNIDIVIVVGPLSCFGPWEKETRAALSGRIATARVKGSARERRSMYSSVRPGELLLMSYATAATDKAELINLCRRLRAMLVVDESHRVKRFRGGMWAPALMDIAKYARVKLTLSGTPMPQTGRDLYSQLRILWPSGELTGAPDDFSSRVDKDFASVLNDVRPFVARTPKEELGLDPYIVKRHRVPLVGTQGEVYQLIENQFRKVLADADSWKDKIEALKRARPIRLLQAAANPDVLNKMDRGYKLPRLSSTNPTLLQRLAAYTNVERPAKSVKALEILSDIISRDKETGSKTVCWSNFITNLDQFSDMVRKELRIPVFQIDGRVPTGDTSADDVQSAPKNQSETDTREVIIDKFLSSSGAAVLVTNPASTSESISLHSTCHNAIYLDRTYDCALFLQSIDRIHRLGLPKGQRVEVHIILAEQEGGGRTIDDLVDVSLSAKQAAMMQLLEGADISPLSTPDSELESAEGDERDLTELLKYLLGEERAERPGSF